VHRDLRHTKKYRSVQCTYAGTEGLKTRKENTKKKPGGANAKLEEDVEEVDPWNFLP
jgi:hypothetical protein